MIVPGEVLALMAALFWSIAVVIFKSLTQKISPFLVNALKNTIALFCFIITLSLLKIPLLNLTFSNAEYIKFIISGLLGMGIADAIFIYSLSKIGANRIAILNCFEPIAVYFFTFFLLGTSLSTLESIGFIIVIVSILVISYEKDQDDIDPKVKRKESCYKYVPYYVALSMVMIKDIP